MSDAFADRLDKAWDTWCMGKEPPDWKSFLPDTNVSCNPVQIYHLLMIDIGFRAANKLPALLTEHYFGHPRLQQADACLNDEQQVELIRQEYSERWRFGESARRGDYQAEFPQHADALSDLRPIVKCPNCGKEVFREETCQTLVFPDCGCGPPPVAVPATLDYDRRGYELIESLDKDSKGGMGEVYRTRDPALGRNLALKVIRSEHCKDSKYEWRFVREAKITGLLNHPNIVAVHNLGRLSDGRLYYTMRLVKGRTFAEILKEEAGKPERLLPLLGIFEKICQAVAYAHSKHIIHRDLKPANVKVDNFGEVQVMDWGLAKQLTGDGTGQQRDQTPDAIDTVNPDEIEDTPGDLSRPGSEMGTPPYMPPEQTLGENEAVDQRADVFALGSILCEILTGHPAYTGTREETRRKARSANLAEAQARLEQCKADSELKELCRECLSPNREDRPGDADAVAQRVAAYQKGVQERLRKAELDRVAIDIRAQEEKKQALVKQELVERELARAKAERRAMRRLLALTVAVLLLVAGGAGVFWWQKRSEEFARRQKEQIDRQQASVDNSVTAALAQAELLERQGLADPLQIDKYHEARESARTAAQLEGASAEVHQRAEAVFRRLDRKAEVLERDRRLVTALEEAFASEIEINTHENRFAREHAVPRFRDAFRSYGIPAGERAPDEVAKQLNELDAPVREAILIAVDEWILLAEDSTLKVKEPHLDWLRSLLDEGEPEGWTKEVRKAAVGDANPAVPWGPPQGTLKELAENAKVDQIPPHALTRLVVRLMKGEQAGNRISALKLLRRAQIQYPNDFWINYYLVYANYLAGNLPEAVRVLTAATSLRANNAGLYTALGDFLHRMGDLEGAILCHKKAIKLSPNYVMPYNNLGLTLMTKGEAECAKKSFMKAMGIDSKSYLPHYNLGRLLHYSKHDLDGAIECYKKAIALAPDYAPAYSDLGDVLYEKKDLIGAMDHYGKAMLINPNLASAYNGLGFTLFAQDDLKAAIKCYNMAVLIEPKYAQAHYNLGKALGAIGDLDGAIASFDRAIELNPKHIDAHYRLGIALADKGNVDNSIFWLRKTIALDSKHILAHTSLGLVLLLQEKYSEAKKSTDRARFLLKRENPDRHPEATEILQRYKTYLGLTNNLRGVLQGNQRPAKPGHAIALAEMCSAKKRHAAATRLYAEAFAADPKLVEDLQGEHCYNAACDAAMAAARQGVDALLLPEKDVLAFRKQALGWLRHDLKAWTELAGPSDVDAKPFGPAGQTTNRTANRKVYLGLAHWRHDPGLASVRESQALDKLPEKERADWQALWREVDDLLKRAPSAVLPFSDPEPIKTPENSIRNTRPKT
jgi:eukaryotic-like serine/threonine-protein kinase